MVQETFCSNQCLSPTPVYFAISMRNNFFTMVISLTFTFRFTHRALSRRLRSDVMSCEGVMLCGVEGKFEQVNLESFDSLQGSMVLLLWGTVEVCRVCMRNSAAPQYSKRTYVWVTVRSMTFTRSECSGDWCVFVSDLYCWDWWMCPLLLSCLCTPQWGCPAEPLVCPALSPDQEFSPGLIGLYQPWPPGLCETVVR